MKINKDSWQHFLKEKNQSNNETELKRSTGAFKARVTKKKAKAGSAVEKENKCSLEAYRWLKLEI